jgi:hypothetical protein
LTRDGEITVARIDLPLIEVHVPQGHGAHGAGPRTGGTQALGR